jgi:hypothetical protein
MHSANPNRDGHSPKGDSAHNRLTKPSGPSSSQPPASSANDSSSSHSHLQQQLSHNMSALTHSGPGATLARSATVQRDEQDSPHAAFVPRSALQEGHGPAQENGISHAGSLLDTQGFRRVNIDIPLGAQSSMFIGVTQKGMLRDSPLDLSRKFVVHDLTVVQHLKTPLMHLACLPTAAPC